jgi:hypothetical protein
MFSHLILRRYAWLSLSPQKNALKKHWLWGTSDYVFFDKIRLRYIFDGADLAILAGFVIWGVYSVVAAYVRKPRL